MIPGAKSSELYVLLSALGVWAAKTLGVNLSPEQMQTGAVEVAKQLHALQGQGFDSTGLYLAAGYLVARTVLKWREAGK